MSEASVWDDPELKSGDYYTFDTIGTTASGRIAAIGTHRWDDGKVDPELTLVDDTTGENKRLTAGQVRLKAELVEKRPNVGDHISVTFASEEKRAGGKTLKHWSVAITPGGSRAAVAAPVAAPVAAAAPAPVEAPAAQQAALPPDVDAAAAALAALSPEQRKALGLDV